VVRGVGLIRSIDDLANSHEGTACFAGMLVGRDDPRPTVGADALLDDGLRARIHARFSQRFDAFEERATHSIWMKWYLNTFLPPVLLTDVLLARMLPVALDQMRFILSDDGRVSAVQIDGTSIDSTGTDPFTRFAPLIFDHFEPLITMWSVRTDVTRRVYWSNVGNTFEAMLRRIESTAGMTPRLREASRSDCSKSQCGPMAASTRWPAQSLTKTTFACAASAACNTCCLTGAFAKPARSRKRRCSIMGRALRANDSSSAPQQPARRLAHRGALFPLRGALDRLRPAGGIARRTTGHRRRRRR